MSASTSNRIITAILKEMHYNYLQIITYAIEKLESGDTAECIAKLKVMQQICNDTINAPDEE